MQKLLKISRMCIASVCMCVCGGVFFVESDAVSAADTNRNRGRAGVATTARMPVMPTLPINSMGNLSVNVNHANYNGLVVPNDTPGGGNGGDNPGGGNGGGDNPGGGNGGGDNPGGGNGGGNTNPECPDGGVRNSKYTVDSCMNDVLACVNGGALPNGINSLFNEDLRNSIMNGMGLCFSQVEYCIANVRRDCVNVYRSASDVWLDFNARKVQPEYYSFVLRRTGLTPNQAENTCWLLDKNTYGASFNAVSNNANVTSEYANKVGAYNGALNNTLSKANPQGVLVNNNNPGVDGQRGHYARWDAEQAQCLLRVAAYNKDEQIKNSWLFGAVGNDDLAQVWKATGDTFLCNKDLFGFSLMNNTKTTAVVGVGGGTLLGAGIGAMAGHGERAFDCNVESHRQELVKQLRDSGNAGILNQYLDEQISITANTINTAQCRGIVDLYDRYVKIKDAVASCSTQTTQAQSAMMVTITYQNSSNVQPQSKQGTGNPGNDGGAKQQSNQETGNPGNDGGPKQLSGQGTDECYFKNLDKEMSYANTIYCDQENRGSCIPTSTMKQQLSSLDKVFNNLTVLQGEKSNRVKTTLTGAGIGAGAGGLATAITALVEKNNINCRVGDGLQQVAFGKSYSIDALRDFYVKWNLHLPDTIAPTGLVTNCNDWNETCGKITDLSECNSAQINYRPGNVATTTLVHSACRASGSVCMVNVPVARSHGACLDSQTPDVPDVPVVPGTNNQ